MQLQWKYRLEKTERDNLSRIYNPGLLTTLGTKNTGRRQTIKCARRVFEITFISFVQNRKIGKPQQRQLKIQSVVIMLTVTFLKQTLVLLCPEILLCCHVITEVASSKSTRAMPKVISYNSSKATRATPDVN